MAAIVTPVSGSRAGLALRKKLAFGIIYAFFMVFSLLCLAELALRVLPLGSFKSAPFRRYDPDIGIALIPQAHVTHGRGCFQGEVSVNQWGMRDRDRSLEKSPGVFRIALLGDSAIEGVHVAPDQVVNIRMEELLADKGYKNVEVLNFGVEGIGTTQEFLIYKRRVRRLRPDLVVLVFTDNDVMNNSSTLQPKAYGIHTWYCPYYDLGPEANLIFRPVEARLFNRLRTFLEAHSEVVYYFERMWSRVNLPLFNYTWQGIPIMWGGYGDPPDAEWRRAWLVTEKVMALLHETVSGDGAKFVVLPWPGFYRIDPDWQRRFSKEVGRLPPDFKPMSMEERLKEIADRNHITLDFLYPYMQAYRDARHLQWPYFSFTCDPHYSALGHRAIAEAIVQRLEEHHLLPESADSPKQ
jgi:lysophospholipase L1-like esterase